MAEYTPPQGDAVDFSFSGGYSPPDGDNVDFIFGLIATVVSSFAISDIYNADGFDEMVVRWTSNIDGTYRIEMGGTGNNTGDLLASGSCIAGLEIEDVITFDQISAASSYSGAGAYRINIYVRSVDGIWTFYE
jgi:hypothetical protein